MCMSCFVVAIVYLFLCWFFVMCMYVCVFTPLRNNSCADYREVKSIINQSMVATPDDSTSNLTDCSQITLANFSVIHLPVLLPVHCPLP